MLSSIQSILISSPEYQIGIELIRSCYWSISTLSKISFTWLWTQNPSLISYVSCQFFTITTVGFVYTHFVSKILFRLNLYDHRLKLQQLSFLFWVRRGSFDILLIKIPSFGFDGSLLHFYWYCDYWCQNFFLCKKVANPFFHFPVAKAGNIVGLPTNVGGIIAMLLISLNCYFDEQDCAHHRVITISELGAISKILCCISWICVVS